MNPDDIQSLRLALDAFAILFFLLGISVALAGIGVVRLVRAYIELKSAPLEQLK